MVEGTSALAAPYLADADAPTYIPGRANSADHPTYAAIRNPLAELPDEPETDDEPPEPARR